MPTTTLAQPNPEVIKICVNRLLFERTFRDGTPSGNRTIIDPRSAAIACQGVSSLTEATNARLCVNRLLYTGTFSDGAPTGQRTIVDPADAARACSLCQDCVRLEN
ncbi:hypothetical protein GS597_11000 [Synechococcales cyanobacterium C]|uniref:Uncharacterized protein n=1 Tax=Petrachloros mirabilis ULC683 TaxID=2781853 RepID=A0A8K2A7L2_9CYAN|nr:hypothetical protein [Petrachloros mirabilis]NCJ07026.1 hypothetical protein [Petrachloros mirabilis ULC683]